MTDMKNIVKGVLAFILTQVIIDIGFSFFLYNVKHPFAFMFNVDDASGYLLASSLLFLPIYFIFGVLSAKVFKMSIQKSLVGIAVGGMTLLSAFWLYFVVAHNADHSAVLMYAILNIPAGWAYMPISNTAGYMNGANLFFTLLPPIAFTFGIWTYLHIIRRKQQKHKENS